jgi:hypothetical protein
VFAGWAGLTYFWSIEQSESEIAIISFVQQLVMIWLIFQWANKPREINTLLLAYVLGCAVAITGTIVSFINNEQTTYLRYAAAGFDVNDLAVIIALGIPMSWYLSLNTTRIIPIILYRLFPVVAFYAIFLTASRTGFIVALMALVYVMWSYPRLGMRSQMLLPAAAVSICIAYAILVPAESLERIMTLGDQISTGNLNSRVDIWRAGLEVLNGGSYWGIDSLWGNGVGTFRVAVAPFRGGVPAAAHNVYLSILVDLGLMGLVMFGVILTLVTYDAFTMPSRERVLWLVLLLQWSMAAMTLNWFMHKGTWLVFGLLIAHSYSLKGHEDRSAVEVRQLE